MDPWRKAEARRKELEELEARLTQERALVESEKATIASLEDQLTSVYRAFSIYIAPLVCVPFGLFIGICVSWIVGFILIAIGLGIAFALAERRKSTLAARITAGRLNVESTNATIADGEAKRDELKVDIEQRSIGFPEIAIADVRFPLEVSQVAGKSVVLNGMSRRDETVLTTVDLSRLEDGLTDIASRARRLLALPPLLAVGESNDGEEPIDRLFGEERELQDLVTSFTLNLGKLRDVNIALPLVSPLSPLVSRLIEGRAEKVSEAPALELSAQSVSHTIDQFVSEVNATKARSEQVFADLRDADASMSGACRRYSSARKTSMNTVHAHLAEVLQRAEFLNRRFYCPRTILNPVYLQDLLGIDPSTAFELPIDQLISRLRSDPEVAKRIADSPDLERQLVEAYWNVREFLGPAAGSDTSMGLYGSPRSGSFDEQLHQYTKLFKDILINVLTGSTYPILNFSAEAQLYYDPETEEWSSDTVPYVYSTPDIMRYGGIVKTYSDILMPMWESLWTEKSDFRKSELFRTNEAMIEMSEKEGRQVIEIANQFRDDMRGVREHCNVSQSEISAKYAEIVSFRDSVEALGLLSERMSRLLSDQRLSSFDTKRDSATQVMERHESQLQMLPEIQAQYRGTARDPIDLVKDPGVVGMHQAIGDARLLPT